MKRLSSFTISINYKRATDADTSLFCSCRSLSLFIINITVLPSSPDKQYLRNSFWV